MQVALWQNIRTYDVPGNGVNPHNVRCRMFCRFNKPLLPLERRQHDHVHIRFYMWARIRQRRYSGGIHLARALGEIGLLLLSMQAMILRVPLDGESAINVL